MFFTLAIIELLIGYFSIYHVSFLAVCFVMFEKGLLFQGIMTASNITLSEKYENGILKGKFVTTVRVISAIFLLFVCTFIVNPKNEP